MLKQKSIRERGKTALSEFFKTINIGDSVVLKVSVGKKAAFPLRMQGKTGKVVAKQGKSLIVKVMDGNKEKTFIVPSIHLKKLKMSQ